MSLPFPVLVLCTLTVSCLTTTTEGGPDIKGQRITFHTCDVPGADFHFPAQIILVSENGEESDQLTLVGPGGRFTQGSSVSLNVTANLTGPVCSVLLWRQKTHTGEGWKLANLEVTDEFGVGSFVINECDVEDDWVKEKQTRYQRKGIDGRWSEWGPWSAGDMHCVRHRHRSCDNPPAMCGGEQCHGNSSQSACSKTDCSRPDLLEERTHHECTCSTLKHFFLKSPFLTLLGVLVSTTSLVTTIVISFRRSKIPVNTEDPHDSDGVEIYSDQRPRQETGEGTSAV